MKPLHDWVLIEIIDEADEVAEGVMFIPRETGLQKAKVLATGFDIDVDDLPSGAIVYYLKYAAQDTKSFQNKLVKFESIVAIDE